MQINKMMLYKIISMLFVVFAVTACNGGTPSSDANNMNITGIQIAPKDVAGALPPAQIPLGASIQYVATAYYDNNTSRDVSAEVAWTSSTPVVTIDKGIITAMQVGSTAITATLSGITSNQVSLSVSNATVIAIQIEPAEGAGLDIPVGLSVKLLAKAIYDDNSSLPIISPIEWHSSNLAVASIDDGNISAKSPGVTQVTANWNGLESNSLDVSVADKTITSLSITAPPSAIRGIQLGISQQYRAVAKFDDDSSQDITSQVNWNSSDVNMATVSTAGLVEAKAVGTAALSANVGNVVSNTLRVTIISAVIQSIKISVTDNENSLVAGFTKQYKASASFSDGSVFDITRFASWRSNEQSILLALTSGRVLGLQSGEAELVAQWKGMSSNSILVSVGDAIPVEMEITPTVVELVISDSSKLTATLTLSDNHTADVSEDVVWNSSDVSVATVSATGLATARAPGTTTITASHEGIIAKSSLVVHEPGQVVAWGSTMSGGDNSAVQTQLTNVKAIYSTGNGSTQPTGAFAVLKQDGSVITWGDPRGGGDSSTVQTELTNIKTITPSGFAFAALKHDGSVITWGSDLHGGDSLLVQDQLHNVQSITANNGSFAALKNDGTVVTWGHQTYGGYSDHVKGQLVNVKAVYHSNIGAAALKEDGTVVTWGYRDGSGVQHLLNDVLAIFSTDQAFAALKSDGTVVTWGDNSWGGNSSSVQSKLVDIKTIYSTSRSFAALKNDGTVVTWGQSDAGGNSSAVQTQLVDIKSISGTGNAFAALRYDGTVVTWGQVSAGGDSEKVQSELYDIQTITAAGSAFAALRLDGKVVTWGDVNRGGNSASVQSELYNVQAIFPNGNSPIKSSLGEAFAALRLDGSLITWGAPLKGGDSNAVQERLKNVVTVAGTVDAFAAIVDTSK